MPFQIVAESALNAAGCRPSNLLLGRAFAMPALAQRPLRGWAPIDPVAYPSSRERSAIAIAATGWWSRQDLNHWPYAANHMFPSLSVRKFLAGVTGKTYISHLTVVTSGG
jgi:hypothetical protein